MSKSSLIGRQVQVTGNLYEYSVTGEVVFIFNASEEPKREDVLKYYFLGDEERLIKSGSYEYIMSVLPYYRLVVSGGDGTYVIVPFNSNFNVHVL